MTENNPIRYRIRICSEKPTLERVYIEDKLIEYFSADFLILIPDDYEVTLGKLKVFGSNLKEIESLITKDATFWVMGYCIVEDYGDERVIDLYQALYTRTDRITEVLDSSPILDVPDYVRDFLQTSD